MSSKEGSRQRTGSCGDLKGVFEQVAKRRRDEEMEAGRLEAKLDRIIEKLDKMETGMEMCNKQMHELKNEFKMKEKKWEVEKNALLERINKLEENEELREKEKRKNNVMIYGLEEEGEADVAVKKLASSLQVTIKIEEAVRLGNKMDGKKRPVLVKLHNWEEKKSLLTKKGILRATKSKVFIDDDLTKREREVQMRIKERAKEERLKGKKVLMRYQKLCIDGIWWMWNTEKAELEKGSESTKN